MEISNGTQKLKFGQKVKDAPPSMSLKTIMGKIKWYLTEKWKLQLQSGLKLILSETSLKLITKSIFLYQRVKELKSHHLFRTQIRR
jgi:hypothetical protein